MLKCRADSAAVAITTTDLVSKSVAVESQVGLRNTLYTLFLALISLTKFLTLLRLVESRFELVVWLKAPG